MPKEKFNEEKKEIAIRIQALIAEGEPITKMMDVSYFFHLINLGSKEW